MLLTNKDSNVSKILDYNRLSTFVVFPFSILQSAIKVNASWEDIVTLINSFVKCRNDILGYNFGNGMTKIMYKDTLFTFSVYIDRDNFVDVAFWDITSTKSVFNLTSKELTIIEKQVNEIQKHLENYCNGIIECSECHKELQLGKDIAGSYYAGVYCNHCWETKWKGIEARDNYD